MELGKKKKAELVERATDAYKDAWDAFVGTPQPVAIGERRGINAVVTLVLYECEARVKPLVEAAENAEHVMEEVFWNRMTKDELCAVSIGLSKALSAYRASLADEPEPKEPTLAEAVEAMLRSSPQIVYGMTVPDGPRDVDGTRLEVVRPEPLDAVRKALAREREKRS